MGNLRVHDISNEFPRARSRNNSIWRNLSCKNCWRKLILGMDFTPWNFIINDGELLITLELNCIRTNVIVGSPLEYPGTFMV